MLKLFSATEPSTKSTAGEFIPQAWFAGRCPRLSECNKTNPFMFNLYCCPSSIHAGTHVGNRGYCHL